MSETVFKIVNRDDWEAAVTQGCYRGSPIDRRDGFIHLSRSNQVSETAAKHFRGQSDLVLVAFRADDFGAMLKWERSRGGQLFPHLYGDCDPARALWVENLAPDGDGVPTIPARVGQC